MPVRFAAVEFDLSPDQRALADAAADLLDGLASPERVRAIVGSGVAFEGIGGSDAGPGDGYDHELWAAMAEQGWPAIEVPEPDGGLGLGMVEVAVLCEQSARRVAPSPFVGSVLCAGALRAALDRGGADPLEPTLTDDARSEVARWASSLSAGEGIGCVAWSGGAVTARQEGARWLLSGRPEPTQHASVADVAVVVADDALYALGLGGGRRPAAAPAMDRTRPIAWLELDAAPSWRIGGGAAAAALVSTAPRRLLPPSCSARRNELSSSPSTTPRSDVSSAIRSAASRR